MFMKDIEKKGQGNHNDPQPDHGKDQHGHNDQGNHSGWDRKPGTSHGLSVCAKKTLRGC